MKVDQLDLKTSTLLWDGSLPSGGLTCCITTPASLQFAYDYRLSLAFCSQVSNC